MDRTLIDRLHDKCWSVLTNFLDDQTPPPGVTKSPNESASISGAHPWVGTCAALSDGRITSDGFRRRRAVREIVEAPGPVDGAYFARLIQEMDASIFGNETFLRVDQWGDPLTWPSFLLGTHASHSPTSLRYLAHALWLKREKIVKPKGTIVEIGVGFGGLAAMNALTSGAITHLVDLPQVVGAASKMLNENGLEAYHADIEEKIATQDYCVISNYAFTELSAGLQESYFDQFIRDAPHGFIVSNANVFARTIGGRSDEDLLNWFRAEGIEATLDRTSEILGPADHLCDVGLIRW